MDHLDFRFIPFHLPLHPSVLIGFPPGHSNFISDLIADLCLQWWFWSAPGKFRKMKIDILHDSWYSDQFVGFCCRGLERGYLCDLILEWHIWLIATGILSPQDTRKLKMMLCLNCQLPERRSSMQMTLIRDLLIKINYEPKISGARHVHPL